MYAILQLGFDTRPLLVTEIPFGANMAIRTEVLRQFQFDPTLGPNQENQVRGEESDLLKRVMSRGCQGVWVGTAKVRHLITRRTNFKPVCLGMVSWVWTDHLADERRSRLSLPLWYSEMGRTKVHRVLLSILALLSD